MNAKLLPEQPGDGVPLFDGNMCVLCKKEFGSHGRASHGLAHERRGEVTMEIDVFGHRWKFLVKKKGIASQEPNYWTQAGGLK